MPTTTYTAGWNTPGYLPEMEPQRFDDLDDARAFLIEELAVLEDEAEEAQDESRAEEASHAQQDINLMGGDDTVKACGFAWWITSETVPTAAEAFSAAFETVLNGNGEPRVCLRGGSPSWMLDAVQAAHDGAWPHDWIWEACRSAADDIAECEDIDEARDRSIEWADSYADSAYHALATWLAEVPGAWAACDEVVDEFGEDECSLDQRIQRGQWLMLRNIHSVLCEHIEDAEHVVTDEERETGVRA